LLAKEESPGMLGTLTSFLPPVLTSFPR
jgi:hypothetical protein